MYRFFVDPSQIHGTDIRIMGRDVNHIQHVLRMKPGEEIAVSNGVDGKEYRCGIEEFLEGEVRCTLRFIKEDGVELPSHIYLFQGLPKADKMELIVQKCVELGVFEIIPVATKRAVVKLDEKKAGSKTERWQGIAEAAAKQSKRGIIPKVTLPVSFAEAVKRASSMDLRLIPYEMAEDGMSLTRELLESAGPGMDIAIFIGPEGGFTQEEIKLALESDIRPITLGKRILRTETAGFTVVSWLMYQLED